MRTALATAIAALFVASPALADERVAVGPSAQTIAISVADAGDARSPLRTGADLEISIAFTQAGTGRPASGLKPRAWIRRIAPGGAASCQNAAWMGRATGAISAEDVALEGSYLVVVGDEDGASAEDRLRVVDPGKQIASANQVSVTPLGGKAAAVLVHPTSPRAFVARPETGDVVAVELPWGGLSSVAGGFRRPVMLAALGDGLVVLDGEAEARLTRLGPNGSRREPVVIGPSPARLAVAADGAALAVAADGAAVLLAADGAISRLAPGALMGPVAAGGGAILSRGEGREALLRFADAPETPAQLALPFEPDGFFVREDGRYALAWSEGASAGPGAQAAVIDIARASVSAAIALPGAVDEAANARRAFVLTHRDVSIATVIDVSQMASGAAPADRRIRLPVQAARAPAPRGAGRLAGSDARGAAVTVRPGSNVALTISAGGGLTDQAVGALTIRGETPRFIAYFDQRLREEREGVFLASARLRRGGRHEVVVTTGPGGSTGCAGFGVEGPGADETPPPALRLVSDPPRAAAPARLKLALDNRPPWLAPGRVTLRFDDRAFGGFERVVATLNHDATLEADITFPDAGDYVARIEDAGPAIEPLVLRVEP